MIALIKDNLVFLGTMTFFVLMSISGYRRGMIKMITSLAGVAVSLFVARYFMPKLTRRMEESNSWVTWVQSEVVPKLKGITASMVFSVLSFLVIFVVTLILIKILAATLDHLMDRSLLGIVNQVLGIVLGAAEALIYVWIFMIVVEVLPHFPICEEILRQINADGFLSMLHDNNLLVAFLANMSTFTGTILQ